MTYMNRARVRFYYDLIKATGVDKKYKTTYFLENYIADKPINLKMKMLRKKKISQLHSKFKKTRCKYLKLALISVGFWSEFSHYSDPHDEEYRDLFKKMPKYDYFFY